MFTIIRNKRGTSRVTGAILQKIGSEYLLPAIAFLVVLYIVISVGSSRGAQTYYQTVEYSDAIDALASFNGFASLRYVPIMDDFNVSITDNVLSVDTNDAKAPKSRIIHLPLSLILLNKLQLSRNLLTLQNRFVRTQGTIVANSFSTRELSIPLGTPNRPVLYSCPQVAKLAQVPLQVEKTASSDPSAGPQDATLTDLLSRLSVKNIPLSKNGIPAGLIVNISTRPANFNSLLIFTDGSVTSSAFACALANSLATIDSAELKKVVGGQNIDSVVLVPATYSPYANPSNTQGTQVSTPQVYLELSYVSGSANTQDAMFNAILANGLSTAYSAVYS